MGGFTGGGGGGGLGGLTRISLTPLIKCSTPPKFRFTPPISCVKGFNPNA